MSVPDAENCRPQVEEEEPFEGDLIGPRTRGYWFRSRRSKLQLTNENPKDYTIRKQCCTHQMQPVVLTIGNGDETHMEANWKLLVVNW